MTDQAANEDLLYDAFAILANVQPLLRGEFFVSGDGLEHGSPDATRRDVEAAVGRWLEQYQQHLRNSSS